MVLIAFAIQKNRSYNYDLIKIERYSRPADPANVVMLTMIFYKLPKLFVAKNIILHIYIYSRYAFN